MHDALFRIFGEQPNEKLEAEYEAGDGGHSKPFSISLITFSINIDAPYKTKKSREYDLNNLLSSSSNTFYYLMSFII